MENNNKFLLFSDIIIFFIEKLFFLFSLWTKKWPKKFTPILTKRNEYLQTYFTYFYDVLEHFII